MLAAGWILTNLGLHGVICQCDGCAGLALPARNEGRASRLPTSQTPHQRHATDNVEHTWEPRRTFLSKRVSGRFSALSDLAPQHPHGTIKEQQGPVEMSCEYKLHTYSFSKLARGAASFPFFLHGDTVTCSKLVAIVIQGWF